MFFREHNLTDKKKLRVLLAGVTEGAQIVGVLS